MTANPKLQKIKFDFSDPDLYNPVYIPVFGNKSRFVHLCGGAGSGKSVFAAQKEIALSFESRRQNFKTLVVRRVAKTIKESVYAEIKAHIYEMGLEDYFDFKVSPLRIENKITGVPFIFFGLDDVEKLKSIQGVDRVWIEEATELNERKDLDQLNLRLRGVKDAQITLTYNKINEFHWLNNEIHQVGPDDHFILTTTYKDNEKLLAKDPAYAEQLEGYKDTNPNYYRIYARGLWGRVTEGLIYDSYLTEAFPQKDTGEDDIQSYGLDFGFSDPCALVATSIKDALPRKRLHLKQLLYKSGLDAQALIEEMDAIGIRKDIPIVADSARPEMISAIHGAGYNVIKSKKFAGSVLSGINNVRTFNIAIDPGSKELFKEISNYQKKQRGGIWLEEPGDNQPEHLLDGARYSIEPFMTKIVPIAEQLSTSYSQGW